MPYDELMGWFAYFEKRPIEWRDDDRSFKVIQSWGFKGKPWDIFSSLGPIYQTPPSEKFNFNSFKKSFLFKKITEAKHGDKIDFNS